VRTLGAVALVTLVAAAPAWAQDPERVAMTQVALTTDAGLVSGCTLVGRVKDDSVKDLRRKIVRLGGDTAVVKFGLEDIYADAYRCPTVRLPPASAAPARIPPPPPGAPPPPPPPR
jgi:hypothetical protein